MSCRQLTPLVWAPRSYEMGKPVQSCVQTGTILKVFTFKHQCRVSARWTSLTSRENGGAAAIARQEPPLASPHRYAGYFPARCDAKEEHRLMETT